MIYFTPGSFGANRFVDIELRGTHLNYYPFTTDMNKSNKIQFMYYGDHRQYALGTFGDCRAGQGKFLTHDIDNDSGHCQWCISPWNNITRPIVSGRIIWRL